MVSQYGLGVEYGKEWRKQHQTNKRLHRKYYKTNQRSREDAMFVIQFRFAYNTTPPMHTCRLTSDPAYILIYMPACSDINLTSWMRHIAAPSGTKLEAAKVAHTNEERPVSWPAASIKRRVNLVRSLVSMTVERRVQPISVGRRSFPTSYAR